MNEKYHLGRVTRMRFAFCIVLILVVSFLTGCGSDSVSGVETQNSFTVTYNDNGATGGSVPSVQTKIMNFDLTVASNTADSTKSALYKTDFAFVGWNTKPDGTGASYMPGSIYSTNSSIILYAQWKEILKFTVTYLANGATGGTVPETQTKVENVALVLASNIGNLQKEGYIFAGWNTDSLGTGITYAEGTVDTINDTLTLYAKWVLTPVQLWNITEKAVLAYETKEVSVDLKPFINVAFSQKAEIFSDIGSVTDSIWKWTPPLGSDSLMTAIIMGTSDSNLYKLSLIITVTQLDSVNIFNDTAKPVIVKTEGPENGTRIADGKIQLSFTVADLFGVDSVYWILNGTSKGLLSQKDSLYTLFDTLTKFDTNTIKVIAVDKSFNKNRDSVTFVYDYNSKISDIVLTSPDKNITGVDTVNVAFTWAGGTDADSDSVAYELRYGTDSTESGLTEKITGMNIQSCKLPTEVKLRPYTNYYWQVVASSRGVYSDTVKSSVYKFKTLIPVGSQIFDLNNGEWDLTRIASSIACVVENGTVVFSGNLTEETFGYIKTAIQNRNKYIALDLGRCIGLDSLPQEAFRSCRRLTEVIIPDGVTSIGGSAFEDCKGLTSITIPTSVTSIGERAFYDCFDLTSVTISTSVTSIGGWAFYNCFGLTSITIPSSVTSIGERAFYNCHRLTSVTIPTSVTSIGQGAFYCCYGLISITISEGVTSIENVAFLGCSGLTSITIPTSVTSIEDGAFSGCSGLTSITIPSSVTSIGKSAFYGCSGLTSVTIPSSVTSIGESVFSRCSGLTSITVPSSVTSIGAYAFSGCSGLTSITIPSSVTSIGASAFSGCSSLTEVTILDGVTSIDDGAFSDCSSLTEVTIPDGVTTIERSVFAGCSSLKIVTIPPSVTKFEDRAFYGCSDLTEITIPLSVTSIGENVFSGCSSLATVNYTGTEEQWNEMTIKSGNEDLTNATINYEYKPQP